MGKYIAEIAGKDSVAAVMKFMSENREAIIVPTIVYTGTEYGDRDSYYNSVDFLKEKGKEKGIQFSETIELQDGKLWNLLCAKYQYLINKKYGFYTPCIACHLFTHLLRLPLLRSLNADGIITGERHSHQGKLKANQHPLTISCFDDIFEENKVKIIRPLVHINDTDLVNRQIGDENIIAHANDIKCVFSGNLQGFELEDNLDMLKRYLEEFLAPVGGFCAGELLKGNENLMDELESKIKEVLL